VKPPEVSLTPQTKEQAMFQQRLHAAIGWAILVIVVAHITLIVLEIVGRLTPVWIGIAVASVAFVSLVALRLRKALRESGPPFDRVSRLAKPKRW
jgi:hypothetical protein